MYVNEFCLLCIFCILKYIYKWTSIKGMRKSYVCIIKNETQPVLGPYDFRVWLQC